MKLQWVLGVATALCIAAGCLSAKDPPRDKAGEGRAASQIVMDGDAPDAFARLYFPGGRSKALIMSCDDGRAYDRQIVEMFNRYGIRGTFNLVSGCLDKDGYVARGEVKPLYAGHEVACHTVRHLSLPSLTDGEVREEIMANRADLEQLVGYPVRGLAYPGGDVDDRVVKLLPSLGLAYSRCVGVHHWFSLPKNPYKWITTCSFSGTCLMEDADLFITRTNSPSLMQVWGHSYDLAEGRTRDALETFCKKVGNRDDIWYATSIEVVDYIAAARNVKVSEDGSQFRNVSATPLWISVNGIVCRLNPGELLSMTDSAAKSP